MSSTKHKSWTWKYYTEDTQNKVQCIIHTKELKCKNTSGMIFHLKSHNIVHTAAYSMTACATIPDTQSSPASMHATSQHALQYSVQKYPDTD